MFKKSKQLDDSIIEQIEDVVERKMSLAMDKNINLSGEIIKNICSYVLSLDFTGDISGAKNSLNNEELLTPNSNLSHKQIECEKCKKFESENKTIIEKFERDLVNQVKQNDSLSLSIESKEKEVCQINKELGLTRETVGDLKKKIIDSEKELVDFKNANQKLLAIKEELESENQDNGKTNQILRNELSSIESKLMNVENELENKSDDLHQKYLDIGSEIEKEVFLPYRDILISMFAIKDIQEDLSHIGIVYDKGISIGNCIAISGLTANSYLALWVRQWFDKKVKKDPKFLDDDEISLINQINKFYRNNYCSPVEYDVLFIPHIGNFDRKLVRDFKVPQGEFKTFSGVYVPGYEYKEKSIFTPAYVEGVK